MKEELTKGRRGGCYVVRGLGKLNRERQKKDGQNRDIKFKLGGARHDAGRRK